MQVMVRSDRPVQREFDYLADLACVGNFMNTTRAKPRVLIVDDEPPIRDLLSQMLDEEYDCVTSGSAEDALLEVQKTSFDLVISDVKLGGMSGVEMVPRLRNLSPETVVMMISGAQSMDTAIDAMRVGVFDYVRKPFNYDQVIAAVRRAITHQRSLIEKRQQEIELYSLVERKDAELHHLSNYDSLTDLSNEAMFQSRVDQVLVNSVPNYRAALLLISISNLRAVRDTFGHETGNRILLEVSHRLRRVAAQDTLSRFHGDRFALMVSHADPNQIIETTEEVIKTLKPIIVADAHEIHAHVHVGISIFPTDGTDYRALAQNAGAALSRAEAEGPGSHQFYSAEMNAQAVERLELENNLRRALESNELSVFYQPKLDIGSRRIVGMEALLRWTSRELGSVSPNVFIPIAESTELIFPIGEWALRTACLQARTWHDKGFNIHLAVNLSGRQFENKNLSTTICDILAETALDPHFLNLEVTESSVVKRPDVAVEILTKLQRLGVSISIDDFGTGHSSLSYLRSLPIDVLKIDKTFVSNVTTNADAVAVVKTIITLAHDLRLRVVAEGVETEEQLRVLSFLGCDEWQGFLHSRPLSSDEFEQKLQMSD